MNLIKWYFRLYIKVKNVEKKIDDKIYSFFDYLNVQLLEAIKEEM